MERFNAHTHFALRDDGGFSLLTPTSDKDTAPLLCTAFASLSGLLDRCMDDQDLDEAVGHGKSLLNCGILTEDHVICEMESILDEIFEWGSAAEASMAPMMN